MWPVFYAIRLLVVGILANFVGTIAVAEESVFYRQCHTLLPIADDFAGDCLQRARPFSRTFYPSDGNRGEVESFSAYFRPLSSPSHFVLGCVLNFKYQIVFAGLYYTPQPLDMSRFDSYKIAFIDFQDNVGLDVDGIQTTFVAVRQFVTDKIPARYQGRPKNCDDPGIEDMNGSKATAYWRVRQLEGDKFEFCDRDREVCKINSYSLFFGMHDTPILYMDLFAFPGPLAFIDESGILILEKQYYTKACDTWRRNQPSVYDLITEVCPDSKSR